MRYFVHQLLAVVSSLILALPPGFCCWFTPHARPNSEPVKQTTCCHVKKTSCCHHEMPAGEQTAPEQAPLKPVAKCCCPGDSAIPEKQARANEGPGLLETTLTHDLGVEFNSLPNFVATASPLHSGPRLHVLQCIWRC